MPSNKMITIKKADGTLEKISLSEFRARKQKISVKKSIRAKVILDSNKSKKPISTGVKKPAINNSNPVSSRIIAQGVVHKIDDNLPKTEKKDDQKTKVIFSKEDAKSLLSEEIAGDSIKHSLDRKNYAKGIVKKMNLNLTADVSNRLIRLVHLRIKDLKSDDEMKEVLKRPTSELGIELNDNEINRLIKFISNYTSQDQDNSNIKPLVSQPGSKSSLMIEPDNELQKYKSPLPPAVSTPNNSFIHSEFSKKEDEKEKDIDINDKKEQVLDKKDLNNLEKDTSQKKKIPGSIDELLAVDKIVQDVSISNLIKKKKEEAIHPNIKDITHPKMVSIGPVDELRYFTLVDFRRMSSKPEEAAVRLKQKFINLRKESYILYLDALNAWRNSPLFNDYIGISAEALNNNKPLEGVVVDREKIQIKEVFALIDMQKELN